MEKNKIYIVLTQTYTGVAKAIKTITKDTYSHASLSLNKECSEMYSFGRKYTWTPLPGIFLKEDLHKGLFVAKPNTLVAIYELKITPYQQKKIVKKIEEIKGNNKGYNLLGLILAKFRIKLNRRKFYCSEFVYETLSSEKVNILSKSKKVFRPIELTEINGLKLIYEGKISDYKG